MKITLIIAAAVLVLLMFLNPSEKQHKDAMKAVFMQAHPLLSLVGGANVVDAAVYHNYIICSTTEFQGQRVSFGIFGNVSVDSGKR